MFYLLTKISENVAMKFFKKNIWNQLSIIKSSSLIFEKTDKRLKTKNKKSLSYA